MEKIKRKQKVGFASGGEDKISILEGIILSAFFPEAKDFTLKEIKERTGYSYERINSSLKSLKSKNMVAEEKRGRTLIYSLNLENFYVKNLGFNAYLLQKEIDFIKKHKNIYRTIKKIINSSFILGVFLFGSYSKGTETSRSDIDLICISQNKKESQKLIKSLNYEFNIDFSTTILTLNEFPKIKKDNPELWRDIKDYSIIFKGEEFFYSWEYKNG